MNPFLALSSLYHNNRSMGWTGKAGWPRYFLDHASNRGLEKCKDSRKLLAFSLRLHQQICYFSYLRNMWPSCFFISCALTCGCFSSLKIQQEEIHFGEPALKLLAQYPAFITEHIATSLSEGGWHSVMGHTMFRSPNIFWRRSPPHFASCMVTAVWGTKLKHLICSPSWCKCRA